MQAIGEVLINYYIHLITTRGQSLAIISITERNQLLDRTGLLDAFQVWGHFLFQGKEKWQAGVNRNDSLQN